MRGMVASSRKAMFWNHVLQHRFRELFQAQLFGDSFPVATGIGEAVPVELLRPGGHRCQLPAGWMGLLEFLQAGQPYIGHDDHRIIDCKQLRIIEYRCISSIQIQVHEFA